MAEPERDGGTFGTSGSYGTPGGSFGSPPVDASRTPAHLTAFATSPFDQAGPSRMAIAALALAVLSWVLLGFLFSLPALLMARSERIAIRDGMKSPAGSGYANAAFWIALANLLLNAVVLVFLVFGAFLF